VIRTVVPYSAFSFWLSKPAVQCRFAGRQTESCGGCGGIAQELDRRKSMPANLDAGLRDAFKCATFIGLWGYISPWKKILIMLFFYFQT